MSNPKRLSWTALFVLTVFNWAPAVAHDPSDPHHKWYMEQTLTPETKARLRTWYTSCCDSGDHYKTRFRLAEDGSKYGQETYEYWSYTEGKWKLIPSDIIQRKPTPDGKPVLFLHKTSKQELCFIIDKEGI